MKIIKILLIVLVVFIIVIGIGSYFLLKSIDTNKIKTQISSQLENVIHRKVEIRDVAFDLSLSKGLNLKVMGISILDDAAFSNDFWLTVESIRLDVDVLTLIKEKRIKIASIQINQPIINLTRNKDGRFNFPQVSVESIDSTSKEVFINHDSSILGPAQAYAADNSSLWLAQMAIASIEIFGGQIIYKDQMFAPEMIIPLDRLEFKVSNFSFDKSFPFNIVLSLWSTRQNIQVDGLVLIQSSDYKVILNDVNLKTNLAELDVERLKQSISVLGNLGIENKVDGNVSFNVKEAQLDASGLLTLSSKGELLDGKVKSKWLDYPIDNIDMHFQLTQKDFILDQLFMYLASGKIEIAGEVKDYLLGKEIHLSLNSEDLHLNEFVSSFKLPVKVEGILLGKFDLRRESNLDPDFIRTMQGEGKWEVREGKLLDLNLVNIVLSRLSIIPNLSENLEQALPPEYKEKLAMKDTVFKKLNMDFKLKDGTLEVEKFEAGTEDFSYLAKGNLDLQMNINWQSDVVIEPSLSLALASSTPELSFLKDDNDAIHIPLKNYSGRANQFKFLPDLENLGKKYIESRGKEELKKSIFKALNIENPADTSTQTSPQPTEDKVSPEKAIIGDVLKTIFK